MSRRVESWGEGMAGARVLPTDIEKACPYCQGKVLRGYKHRAEFQKCYQCHRVSWQEQKVGIMPPAMSYSKPQQGKLW